MASRAREEGAQWMATMMVQHQKQQQQQQKR